jgi:superfamily II DNA or RNA helicase
MTTAPTLTDSTMPLAEFLETYKAGITKAVTDAYPPLVTRAEPIPGLLRKPLGYQAEAITAVALSLREHRNTLLVGEMGTGKSFCSIASAYKAGMQRVLVMCPPHLVEKWAREIHETVPGAKTRILESITQVEALRWEVGTGPLFAILSREKAKLSHAWRPAYVMRKKRLKDDVGHWSTFSYPSCPGCGEVLETPEGLLTHDDLARKRRTCDWCGEQLWQADPKGPRRYALGHYIAEKLPGFFDLLVLDEMHELKSGGSAQGIAAGALAEAIPHTLGLTGTLFGGYASNLHFLLQRFSPAIRSSYGYHDEQRFVAHYGILERTTREDSEGGEDGRVSRRKKTATVRERPGLSPALLPHLLFNTIFLRLTDVATALPPYHEEIAILHMADEQKDVHRAFKAELAAEVQAQLACGSKKLLGAYLQSLLHHPDTPWREEAVYTTDVAGVPYLVAAAEALDDAVVYPKEQRLIDIAKEEKRNGRRLMVFVQGTERRDITGRLCRLLEREGLRVAVLKSHTTTAKKREAWVAKEVEKGVDMLICHPRIVQTGLDLIAFPTLVFYQTEYSVYTLRQASRRSWRIGQDRPVKVIHLAYEETLQTQALGLVAKKAQASLALEGELVEGGLVAMAEDDLMLSLAKALIAGDDDLPITDLSSAYGEEDDFITALQPLEQSVLDALDDLFGSMPRDETLPVLAQDAGSQPVVRIAFTDAPVTLGKSGRRKKVAAGVGILFPEMMVA